MLLSIIVPVYNTAKDGLLEYCLNSLVNQTVKDFEIITVDDASTDNSLEVLKRFAEQYPDIVKVISLPENLHQGGAKNKGLSVCRGEFIGFVDSDDWVTPDYFKNLINRALETGADMVACDICRVKEHSMIPGIRETSNRPEQFGKMDHDKRVSLILHPGTAVTKVYRRDLFFCRDFSYPEKKFFEDNATGIELVIRSNHFEYCKESLYFYYQHDNSTVHTITEERCEDRLEAMRIMLKYAKQNGYFDEFREVLEYKFTNLFYQNTLFSYMQGCKHIRLAFIRKMGKEMRETFPLFEKNRYYIENVNPEEKKLMHMQQLSTVFFFCYYKLLYFVRRIKKKLK